MANKPIHMFKLRQVLRHYTEGVSKKKISELTGIARNTVKRYILRFTALKLTYEDISGLNDQELEELFAPPTVAPRDGRFERLQQLLPGIEKAMSRKGASLLQLWEAYAGALEPSYGYTQFIYYYRLHISRIQPVMHMDHKAGDKVYIDFAGEKLSYTDMATGEVKEVEVFAAILGCSQLTYVEAVPTQRKEDLIQACENALRYFGGVPCAIVPDNLKSAVTKSSRFEPVINESFAGFAEHYGTTVLPARAYRPRDKALVEGVVKIIYNRIYQPVRQQVHHSLAALNAAILTALEQHNTGRFKGRSYSRRDRFEELERSALRPLPVYRYEYRQQALVTVMKNGHACLGADRHYYSVPYRFIGKKVKLLYTSTQVEIFFKYERIAVHARQFRKYHYSTQAEHLASAHRYVSEWTPDKFIREGALIHPEVERYILDVLEHKTHPEQAYKSCAGILGLVRKVGPERLGNACRRAGSFGVYNYPIIVQILEKKMDYLSEEEKEELTMPPHHNIRGEEYYN